MTFWYCYQEDSHTRNYNYNDIPGLGLDDNICQPSNNTPRLCRGFFLGAGDAAPFGTASE